VPEARLVAGREDFMDYFGIVKKAFSMPWKYRFLFWLGVLASFAAGGGGGSSNFTSYSGSSSDFQNLFNNDSGEKSSRILNTLKGAPRVLGASTDKFTEFISHNIYWIALVILIIVLIGVALLIFGTFARAGIVRSVPRLEKKQKCEFAPMLWDGKRYFWRLVGAFFLVFLLIILIIAVLGGIAVPLFMAGSVYGFLWLVPSILFFIIAAIYIGLVVRFWETKFIVEDKGVIESIKPSVKLVNSRFKEVLFFWLISIVLNIIFTMVVFIVFLFLVLPFVLLAIGVGIANLIAGIIIGAISLIIIYLAMLAITGYYTAGITSYWTLAYLELAKK